MNNKLLQLIQDKGICDNHGVSYDEYINLNKEATEIINNKNPETLEYLFELTNNYPSAHMFNFIEQIAERKTIQDKIYIFNKYINCDCNHKISLTLDLITLEADSRYFDLLIKHDFFKHPLKDSFIQCIVSLFKELKSIQFKEVLIEAFNKTDDNRIKLDIYHSLKKHLNISLELPLQTKAIKAIKTEKRMSHLVNQSTANFKNKKYKTIIKDLSQFDENELNDLGKKYLKISKSKLNITK